MAGTDLDTRESLKTGLRAGLLAMAMALLGAFPSRLLLSMREGDDVVPGLQRIVAGTLVDASAVIASIGGVVVCIAVVLTGIVSPLRRTRWWGVGPVVVAMLPAFATMVLSMIAQQVYAERGAFPTAFDILESGGNASFIEGVFGFLGYRHIFVPTIVTAVVALVILMAARRTGRGPRRVLPWAAGLAAGVVLGVLPVQAGAKAVAGAEAPLSPEALGQPLAGLIDSSLDLLRYGDKATPRQLVVDLDQDRIGDDVHARGAALLGWPQTPTGAGPHPYARTLDVETTAIGTRGAGIGASLRQISSHLFAPGSDGTAAPAPIVFHLLLEGFRADDIHALNPDAPRDVAPFVNGLYERAAAEDQGSGDLVLVAHRMHQAGVRTAQGLGAMTCGLGTLPWNLSFIRDLQPIELRCTVDVLHDAGATSSVWYGSDISFDNMHRFFDAHGTTTVVSQKELPADLPQGTWDAVTDVAVVDAAVAGVAKLVRQDRSQAHHALVMSLSNHSPFTAPQDLPEVVRQRVEAVYAQAPRADEEDRRRLMTFSYTDFAVERLFAQLEVHGLSDRAIVVLMADHSTGHRYVWGEGRETDDAFGRIPFALVVPKAFVARVTDQQALGASVRGAQAGIDAGPISLNDVPTMLLSTLSAAPALQALPPASRWHTLGGQVTSPHYRACVDGAVVHAVNGVSQLVAIDAAGVRIGEATRSTFLQSSADRYRLSPELFPAAAPLSRLLRSPPSTTTTPAAQP